MAVCPNCDQTVMSQMGSPWVDCPDCDWKWNPRRGIEKGVDGGEVEEASGIEKDLADIDNPLVRDRWNEEISQGYRYRAYCDICKEGGPWFEGSVTKAQNWRAEHFDERHPDNPMVKENCRIQRRHAIIEDSDSRGGSE